MPSTFVSIVSRGLAAIIIGLSLGADSRADQADRSSAAGFGFPEVQAQAEALAAAPFEPAARPAMPAALQDLDYDRYQAIHHAHDLTLWAGADSMMRLQLFPAGFLYEEPVSVSVIRDGVPHALQPTADWFRWYGAAETPADETPIPLAGFRVLFPLHEPDHHDEVAVFLGASYFRLLGREQAYGLSARGLAIDTALPSGEEFPSFRAFWLEQPRPDDRELRFHALLDGPSLAGAYSFRLRPGTRTTLEVEATLYPRRDIAVLGVAPLTSMFLSGGTAPPPADDFRPHIHDSDGLLILDRDGEPVWRPLRNPAELATSSFELVSPRGFGLLQRNRDFASYLDTQARYHRRPSLWIEPGEDWGEGEIRLVEIPTDSEYHDNIAAFWVPRRPVTGGTPLSLRYRAVALAQEERLSPLGRAVATRLARPASAHGARSVLVDFAGGDLGVLRPQQPVTAEIGVTAGQILHQRIEPELPDGSWRLVLDVEADGGGPVELQARLVLHGEALTETWRFTLPP